MLEHITSCVIVARDTLWFLIAGLLIASTALLYLFFRDYPDTNTGLFGIGIGLILAIFYFVTRKKEVVIASPSMPIRIDTSNISVNDILDFVNLVQRVQIERMESVGKDVLIA